MMILLYCFMIDEILRKSFDYYFSCVNRKIRKIKKIVLLLIVNYNWNKFVHYF